VFVVMVAWVCPQWVLGVDASLEWLDCLNANITGGVFNPVQPARCTHLLGPTPIFRLISEISAKIATICAYELRSDTDGGGTRRN